MLQWDVSPYLARALEKGSYLTLPMPATPAMFTCTYDEGTEEVGFLVDPQSGTIHVT